MGPRIKIADDANSTGRSHIDVIYDGYGPHAGDGGGALEQRTREVDGGSRLRVAKAYNDRDPCTSRVPSIYGWESRDRDDELADAMAGSSSKMLARLAIYLMLWRAQHGGVGDSRGTN